MAGDWIKMRLDLQTHPKIVRIMSATKADKFRVVGGLHAVWSVFDTHSADGRLDGYTADLLDQIIGWPGFAAAMIGVDWLSQDEEEALLLPDHDEHNGKSGKRRAEDQKRKRDDRKNPESVRKTTGQISDKKRTREEKRREENTTPSAADGDADLFAETSPQKAKEAAFDPWAVLASLGVKSQIAKDWLALRKTKKAPVSATALAQIAKEAQKANLPLEQALEISCKRGWTGFESSWLRAEDLAGAGAKLPKDWL